MNFFLITFLALQIYDTQKGWAGLRNGLMWPEPPEDGNPLVNSFWGDAAKKYKKVVRVPISHKPTQWGILARFAADNHMSTNSVSFARIDREKLENANTKYMEALLTGKYNPDTMYVIDQWKQIPIQVKFDAKKDLFARVDGLNIIAPGWRECIECKQVSSELEISRLAPPTNKFKKIYFRRNDSGRDHFLLAGWSWPGEDWGTWSDQDVARLLLPMPENDSPAQLVFDLRALVAKSHPTQTFRVSINKLPSSTIVLDKTDDNKVVIQIPISERSKPQLDIEFILLSAISPQDLGLGNGDTRRLAIGLKSLELR